MNVQTIFVSMLPEHLLLGGLCLVLVLDILGRLPGEPAPMHRYYAMIARAHASLYAGELEEAMALIEGDWDEVERSMIFRPVALSRLRSCAGVRS